MMLLRSLRARIRAWQVRQSSRYEHEAGPVYYDRQRGEFVEVDER